MIELRAIGELEPALAEQGFFSGDTHEVAEVYLGYRLSEPLRRTPMPAPPETCSLPALAFRIRPVDEPRPRAGDFAIGDWEPTWEPADYMRAIEDVRAAIARGDVYQVNLVQHLSASFEGDPNGIAAALERFRPLQPRPLNGDGWTIVSASPELLL